MAKRMTEKERYQHWWYEAARRSPIATAFVGKNDKWVWVNRAFCEVLGYSSAELEEMTWREVTPHKQIGADDILDEQIRSGEKPEVFEHKKFITKAGSTIMADVYAHRYPEAGELEGRIVFVIQHGNHSEHYKQLHSEFVTLKQEVQKMAEDQKRLDTLEEKHHDLVRDLVRKHGESSVSIGGDMTGHDKTTNDVKTILYIAIAGMAIVLGLGVLAMGGKLLLTPRTIEVQQKP